MARQPRRMADPYCAGWRWDRPLRREIGTVNSPSDGCLMNIFNDFLVLLAKVAIICLLAGLLLGFWLAQNGAADSGVASTAIAVTTGGLASQRPRRLAYGPRPPQPMEPGRAGAVVSLLPHRSPLDVLADLLSINLDDPADADM